MLSSTILPTPSTYLSPTDNQLRFIKRLASERGIKCGVHELIHTIVPTSDPLNPSRADASKVITALMEANQNASDPPDHISPFPTSKTGAPTMPKDTTTLGLLTDHEIKEFIDITATRLALETTLRVALTMHTSEYGRLQHRFEEFLNSALTRLNHKIQTGKKYTIDRITKTIIESPDGET